MGKLSYENGKYIVEFNNIEEIFNQNLSYVLPENVQILNDYQPNIREVSHKIGDFVKASAFSIIKSKYPNSNIGGINGMGVAKLEEKIIITCREK